MFTVALVLLAFDVALLIALWSCKKFPPDDKF
jgi:hypothetical protein